MSTETIDSYIYLVFIAIGIILALIILFSAFLIQKNKLVNEKLKSELEYERKVQQSELRALRAQMNPHFIHNSLNAILFYVQRNDVALSEKYLSRFSKLIRQFFEYSRSQYIPLTTEIDLLENYLEIEKMRFENKLNWEINVARSLKEENPELPSMMVQPLVENAINHGIFHLSEPGFISISFLSYSGSQAIMKIIVEDNGVGMERSREIQGAHKSHARSHSSQVLEERINLLQHNNEWEVNINIEDLFEARTEKTGTRVTLTLNYLNYD
ncbi:sensor histidine kinase [Luteirhabdus pelagi]|uniref:sensor histidine kinase n=1 Tax=Luteirhabdus pelagi TaxID=2792783 RepID=UPI001939676D|nr:histidine kinase [Luteirhabdus pelagi]